jgi:hypothetical protein
MLGNISENLALNNNANVIIWGCHWFFHLIVGLFWKQEGDFYSLNNYSTFESYKNIHFSKIFYIY